VSAPVAADDGCRVDGDRFPGYPTDASDTSRPYVMWAGTPDVHLMTPVK